MQTEKGFSPYRQHMASTDKGHAPGGGDATAPAAAAQDGATARQQCQYVVPRKKRLCRMTAGAGKRFCGEHIKVAEGGQDQDGGGGEARGDDRVPCPFDPKHTCYRSRLQGHLKKCRSRPAPLPEYCRKGANLPPAASPGDVAETASIGTATDQELLDVIRRVDRAYESEASPRVGPERQLPHPALSGAVSAPGLGPAGLKHLLQNASLLRHMEEERLVVGRDGGGASTVVEFGSGRGMLTFWLARAAAAARGGGDSNDQVHFVLVDRASHRHKFDNKLKEDGSVSVERIRADIGDLVLGKVPTVVRRGAGVPLVGVSKHLCGGATDLALRCMAQLQAEEGGAGRIGGIVIALCCHHRWVPKSAMFRKPKKDFQCCLFFRCTWDLFVGKPFLGRHSFSERDFCLLRGLTSWATCGSGRPRDRSKDKNDSEEKEENQDASHRYCTGGNKPWETSWHFLIGNYSLPQFPDAA